MITVSNVSLTFGGQKLFSGADLKFMPGNCYGVIGANGAGKSTFLRILSGDWHRLSGVWSIWFLIVIGFQLLVIFPFASKIHAA